MAWNFTFYKKKIVNVLFFISKNSQCTFDCASGWNYHVPAYNGCPPEKGNNRRVLPLPASDPVTIVGSVFCLWTLG